MTCFSDFTIHFIPIVIVNDGVSFILNHTCVVYNWECELLLNADNYQYTNNGNETNSLQFSIPSLVVNTQLICIIYLCHC